MICVASAAGSSPRLGEVRRGGTGTSASLTGDPAPRDTAVWRHTGAPVVTSSPSSGRASGHGVGRAWDDVGCPPTWLAGGGTGSVGTVVVDVDVGLGGCVVVVVVVVVGLGGGVDDEVELLLDDELLELVELGVDDGLVVLLVGGVVVEVTGGGE